MLLNVRPRTTEELQTLRKIFDAAHCVASTLPGGIQDVTVDQALAAADVSSSSAADAFANAGLADQAFREELQADLERQADLGMTSRAISSVLARNASRLATENPTELGLVLREITRVALNTNMQVIGGRTTWHGRLTSEAIALATSEGDHEQLERFRRVDDVARCRIIDLYREVARTFGIRPREPMTIEEFTDTAISALEGVMRLARIDRRPDHCLRPTGPNGELQDWSPAALVFEGVVLAAFESDPWAAISADLSTWR